MVLAVSAAPADGRVGAAVVLFVSAEKPVAVFGVTAAVKDQGGSSHSGVRVPLVLSNNAAAPTAVLESALFNTSAPTPTPVLKLRCYR